jgi:transcriptional regulator with XRE-family HTH domain
VGILVGMTLAQYLSENDLRQADFAKAIGSSLGGVAKWLNGQRVPSTKQMKLIVKATGGAVTPNDFFHECRSPGEAAE